MTGKRRSRWAPGAIYAVPLDDGSYGFAQAVDAMMVNVIYVALFHDRVATLPSSPPALRREHIVALTATWRQHLDRGDWPRLVVAPLVVKKSAFPNERFARSGYVGATHYDAGVLGDFLSAYHGLLPWNVLAREDHYDEILAPGVPRPRTALILSPEERTAYRASHFNIAPPVA